MQTKNNTSNNNLVSIQLKLSDSNHFPQVLKEKTFEIKKYENLDKRVQMTDIDHYQYINPICPHCNSNDIIKQGNRCRIVNFPFSFKHKIFLKKYQCKKCGKYFQTEVNSLVEKYKNYSVHFKEIIRKLLKNGYVSSRKSAVTYEIYWDYAPSHQTMKNMVKNNEDKRIINSIDTFSGYYSYDESYYHINGIKAYRLTLMDTIFNYPVAEEISFDLKSSTIKSFIKETTENIPVECVITDHVPKYKNILDDLGYDHQLCLFHFFQMVTRLREVELKKVKGDEVEEEIIRRDCNELKEIFRAPNIKECKKRYRYFVDNLDEEKEYLSIFINKNVEKNFKRLTLHYSDSLIERTSNKNENYYRCTDNDRIKNRFKKPSGLLDFLSLKMENSTEKTLEKIDLTDC